MNLRILRRDSETQPLLTRRSASLEFSLLHGRAAALLALSEHYKMEVDRGALTGSLALPSRELLEQACEILERALPRPKAWLNFFRAILSLISNDWSQMNTRTINALKSEEEEFKHPLIRSIFGALYLLALKRAEILKLGEGASELSPEDNKYAQKSQALRDQLSIQRRRAGIAIAPEVSFINAIR